MRTYLASPANALQADHARGMPVLMSFVAYRPFLDQYLVTYPHVLLDSGAFSELNTGKTIDGEAYKDWKARYEWVDAAAGLDDISGNWRRSVRNYEQYGGFPTMHDTDPPELLDDLIPLAYAQGGWLGIGLKPPRHGKEAFVRSVCDRVPLDLHLHGWALRSYAHIGRLNSLDSTNWWRDAMKLRTIADCAHLSYGEALEIVVKRYQRWGRKPPAATSTDRQNQMNLLTESA